MSMNVNTKTVIFNTNGCADEIKKALVQLGGIDGDFSGENGDEYLWDAARIDGFETNAEFLAHKIVTDRTIAKISAKKGILAYTESFAKKWLRRDSYYADIKIDVVKLDGLAEDTNISGVYAFTVIAKDFN